MTESEQTRVTIAGATTTVPVSGLDRALGLRGVSDLLGAMRTNQARRSVCPVCGWTLQDTVQTGLMGCGACYTSLDLPVLTKESPADDGKAP